MWQCAKCISYHESWQTPICSKSSFLCPIVVENIQWYIFRAYHYKLFRSRLWHCYCSAYIASIYRVINITKRIETSPLFCNKIRPKIININWGTLQLSISPHYAFLDMTYQNWFMTDHQRCKIGQDSFTPHTLKNIRKGVS